jgi:hypothetical protein
MFFKETNKSKKNIAFYICLTFLIGSFLSGSICVYLYFENASTINQKAFDFGKKQALFSVNIISKFFKSESEDIVNPIVKQLTVDKVSNDTLETILDKTTSANPDINGVAIAYSPFSYKEGLRLYSLFRFKDKDGIFQNTHIEDEYDYTIPQNNDPSLPRTNWYILTMETQKPYWTEPFWGTIANTFMITYSTPFFKLSDSKDVKTPAGVVVTAISMDQIRKQLLSVDLEGAGYSFILSKNRKIFCHPQSNLNGSTIDTLEKKKWTEADYKQAANQENFFKEDFDQFSGRVVLSFFNKIPELDWTLITIFDKQKLLESFDTNSKGYFTPISISILLFLLSLSLLIFKGYEGKKRGLIISSVIYSLSLLFLITYQFHRGPSFPLIDKEIEIRIFDKASLHSFLSSILEKKVIKKEAVSSEKPEFIPTGFLIETISFKDKENEVEISGYIWQKYPDENIPPFEIDFLHKKKDFFIEEVYRQKRPGEVTVGWRFAASLAHNYKNFNYPFDQRSIKLKIYTKNIDRKIIFVPDFDSYDLTDPAFLPGLDNIHINGWEFSNSYFSYLPWNPSTNFGISTPYVKEMPFTLQYNAYAKRIKLEAVMSYFPPLLIVLLLSFLLLVMIKKDKNSNFISPLSFESFMIFVVASTQGNIRQNIFSEGLIYFEYFIFVAYGLIFLCILNIMVYLGGYGTTIKFIEYEENLFPKLLYWPLCFTVIYIIML